jgi:low affinity Fe/Cu permease
VHRRVPGRCIADRRLASHRAGNTQNRDARATHLKLDELLRAAPKARGEFMEAEEEDLDEIERGQAIVETDDPAPPRERPHDDEARDRHRGNGKT